jgi:hypothetical protein
VNSKNVTTYLCVYSVIRSNLHKTTVIYKMCNNVKQRAHFEELKMAAEAEVWLHSSEHHNSSSR